MIKLVQTKQTAYIKHNGLGLALRILRENRKLTLREIGKLSDVDHAYINRLENGEKNKPSIKFILKLFKTLKPSVRDAAMIEWLIRNPETDCKLVSYVLSNPNVSFNVFAAVASLPVKIDNSIVLIEIIENFLKK